MATLGMLLLLLSTTGVAMASDCYSTISEYNLLYGSLRYKSESFYCKERCCGVYSGYQNCCTDMSTASALTVAGMAIGSLVGGGLFVAFFRLCLYCIKAKLRSRTPTTGRDIRTPVTRPVFGTPATRPHITYINAYSVQPENTVQPGMQPYRNQGFTPDAGTALIPGPVTDTPGGGGGVECGGCDKDR
ncbi:uncharacterized protein LOC110461268 [Mizuhopecten yessoensis]|uniref:uncharacterized protein LOC110461268 n=1 Tax=Mizuhopecten yessoensis TaxID=6573 RepID=UPI000B45CE6A|nr:uncharacterized protein LOC110461268 [Mizuhopecten yessoensis]